MKRVNCLYLGDEETHKCRFTHKERPTDVVLSSAFVTQEITMPGGRVQLDLWDTASEEQYRSLAKAYAKRERDIFVFFFSLVRPSTLDHIEDTWAPLALTDHPNTPTVLVGVDSDLLAPENRGKWEEGMSEIPSERIEQVKNAIHAVEYVQCTSADYRTHDTLWNALARVGAPELQTAPPSKCDVA